MLHQDDLLGVGTRLIRSDLSSVIQGLSNIVRDPPPPPVRPFGSILADIANVEQHRDQAIRDGDSQAATRQQEYLDVLEQEVQTYRAVQERTLHELQRQPEVQYEQGDTSITASRGAEESKENIEERDHENH